MVHYFEGMYVELEMVVYYLCSMSIYLMYHLDIDCYDFVQFFV